MEQQIDKECWIGIDQSLNSTGMTIQFSDKPNVMFFQFVTHSMKHSSSVCFVEYGRVKEKTDDFTTNELNIVRSAHNLSKSMFHYINLHCSSYDKWNVAIEGQVMSGFSKRQMFHLTDLVKLVSIVEYNLLKLNKVNLKIVPPTSVKKYFTGSGRAKKEDMLKEFKLRVPNFDFTGKVDDIADSFALSELLANPKKVGTSGKKQKGSSK